MDLLKISLRGVPLLILMLKNHLQLNNKNRRSSLHLLLRLQQPLLLRERLFPSLRRIVSLVLKPSQELDLIQYSVLWVLTSARARTLPTMSKDF